MIKKVSERIKDENIQFDVLGDILETLRFRGSIFFRSELAAPWGMSLEKTQKPRFHIAWDGDFFIGAEESDGKEIQVNQMDIVMIPNGNMHWVADKKNRQLTPSGEVGDACELGAPLFQQGKITHKIICGVARYDDEILHPILDSLPSLLHFSDLQINDPIWMTVVLIDTEMTGEYKRRISIVDRLTEVLFLQLLNKYALEHEQVSGFFLALRNRRIYRALELIHQHPQKQWTLASLGKKTAMSRATLMRQFNHTVGVSPMTYLAKWRMAKAFHWIKYSSMSIDDIADQVGFSTARTLNKAFQRHYGLTPYQLRHL